jgi:hypothetical protein
MNQSPSWKANSCPVSQEIPPCYGTLSLITLFTRDRHWSLPRASWIQSTSSHYFLQIYFNIIFRLCVGLPRSLPFQSPDKTFLCVSNLSHPCSTSLSSFHLILLIVVIILVKVQIMNALIMQFSRTTHHFLPVLSTLFSNALCLCFSFT